MKTFKKVMGGVVALSLTLGLAGALGLSRPAPALAFPNPLPVPLLTAGSFAILAGTPNITDAGGTSVITGNVGLSPATGAGIGLTCAQVTGTIYSVNAAGLPCFAGNPPLSNKTIVDNAKIDLTAAYINAAGRVVDATKPTELGGTILTAGVYDSGSTTFQITAGAGPLVLDGAGDSASVFIFKMGFAGVGLTVGPGSVVNLINGAQARNVFWQVDTAAINTTATFKGNILALNSITAANASVIEGRLLARNGNVTLINNTITATSLELNKVVINNNGGTALPGAWTLTATGAGLTPTNLTGVTPVRSGASFEADTYTLAETGGPAGYTASAYSCVTNGGLPVVSNVVTIAAGDNVVCTITNDDVAGGGGSNRGTITVVKHVVNDNGRTKMVADFPLFVNGSTVASGMTNSYLASAQMYVVSETTDPNYTRVFSGDCDSSGNVLLNSSDQKVCIVTNDDIGAPVVVPPVPPLIDIVKVPDPLALPAGPGAVTYNYTLSNIGTVPVTNITMIDDSCSTISMQSGDTNADSKLQVGEIWKYHCFVNLTETHTNTVVATGWANGLSATDIAQATVVVGIPVVPPLIHVTKIPSPLTLLAGGGMVTYTKKVTNPGTVALSNVAVTDDKCGPVRFISGDANSDSKLDPSETWTYTCTANLTKTTVNTAVATGEANGLVARDFAIATVVVAAVVPSLPNTGFASMGNMFSFAAILGGILAVSVLYFIARKKSNA